MMSLPPPYSTPICLTCCSISVVIFVFWSFVLLFSKCCYDLVNCVLIRPIHGIPFQWKLENSLACLRKPVSSHTALFLIVHLLGSLSFFKFSETPTLLPVQDLPVPKPLSEMLPLPTLHLVSSPQIPS